MSKDLNDILCKKNTILLSASFLGEHIRLMSPVMAFLVNVHFSEFQKKKNVEPKCRL